jgi:hypothetical protein
MVNTTKVERKPRTALSTGQNKLLRESLKQLIGDGLIYSQPQRTQHEKKASFLKDAVSSKILDPDFLD